MPVLRLRWTPLAVLVTLCALNFIPRVAAASGEPRAHTAVGQRSAAVSAKKAPLLWGAWIGSQLTGRQAPWDFNAVRLFEQHAGKGMSILNFSSPFMDCSASPCKPYTFPWTPFNTIRAHGSIPLFSWNSAGWPVKVNEPEFRLSAVASGRYDDYIRTWAAKAKQWGGPFFLRFNWEMNGTWFPWAEGTNGNRPGDYVAAWRHVHDIFTQVGATNAKWVWCPNIDPKGTYTPLRGLYPGDQYVDWTCLDGYAHEGTKRSFSWLYTSAYAQIATKIAPAKPMMVGEVAAPEDGGKARWITDMFSALPESFPAIRALVWFESDLQGSWPIETSSGAQAAFRAGIGSSAFAANSFAGITALPGA